MSQLPPPYVECVIHHKRDDKKRIGRLNETKTHWQLSSYQNRKCEVVWLVEDVDSFEVITGMS